MTTKQEFPNTLDANVWAIEFMKCVDKGILVDEDWMRAWFANAIMAGYDTFRVTPSELREWCEERLAEWQEQLTDYYSEVSEGIAVDEDTVNFLKDLIKEHQDLLARFCKEGK